MRKCFFRLKWLSLALVISVLASMAWAADEGPLKSEMKAYRVAQDENGRERLIETNKIYPDQVIEYVLVYENVGERPLLDVQMIGPIPSSTRYIGETATVNELAIPIFSIDQGVSFKPEPVTYMVTLPNGEEEERVATPDMYTHARWDVYELKAGEKVEFRYRVMVR